MRWLKSSPLIFFVLCSFYALVIPGIIPTARLTYFAPFLILCLYQKPLITTLWLSLGVGLLIDILSVDTPFGICAFSYCAAAALLYQRKQMFFEDSRSTIPVMSGFFAVIATATQACILIIIKEKIPFSLEWIGSDLVAMPILDALYALFAIVWPLKALENYMKKRPIKSHGEQ